MPVNKGIDNGNHPLIPVIEQVGRFLFYKFGCHLFKFLMVGCVSRHHSCSHRISESVLCSVFCISFPYFRIVCQSEIIVQAPVKYFLSSEFHSWRYLTLKLREHEIAITLLGILPEGTFV